MSLSLHNAHPNSKYAIWTPSRLFYRLLVEWPGRTRTRPGRPGGGTENRSADSGPGTRPRPEPARPGRVCGWGAAFVAAGPGCCCRAVDNIRALLGFSFRLGLLLHIEDQARANLTAGTNDLRSPGRHRQTRLPNKRHAWDDFHSQVSPFRFTLQSHMNAHP